MSKITEAHAAEIRRLGLADRKAVLEALDAIVQPMTRRQIEKALAPALNRQARLVIVPALMDLFTIVAIERKPCED